MSALSDKEFLRYNRHVMVGKIGEQGQAKFKQAHAIIVGMGGLGCPAAQYLAASGIGHLTLIDHDVIELSNLQRQVLYSNDDIGQTKVATAQKKLLAMNPLVAIDAIEESVFDVDFYELCQQADLILDCTDNPKTRKFINAICVETGSKLISASAIQANGQLVSFDFSQQDAPCYACLFPADGESKFNCQTAGVVSPVLGVLGSLQATEALRLCLGENDNLHQLTLFDAWGMQFRKFKVNKDPDCAVCGSRHDT